MAPANFTGAEEADEERSKKEFSFPDPTELIEIPSMGEYYPEGHALCGKTHVELRYPGAAELDTLNTKSLMRKNLAVDNMLENIVVNKLLKLESLLVGDKTALIIASRVLLFNEDYQVDVKCPYCGKKTLGHKFDLSALELKRVPNEDDLSLIGVTKNETSIFGHPTFSVEVPKTKSIVEFKFLTVDNEKAIDKIQDRKKASKLKENPISEQLKKLIVSVNGNSELSQINQFLAVAPAPDLNTIMNLFKLIQPDVKFEQEFECIFCNEVVENLDIPFDKSFFWK